MPINLTGMASGLDTDSIISQLMAIEQNKVTAVQMKQVKIQSHKDNLDGIRTALNKVKSAASDLATPSLWKPTQTTGSSDTTKLDVTVTGGAGIGGHSIQINRLAASAQHGAAYTAPTTDGSLTFYYGTDPNATGASKVTIPVAANATVSDVATAINANDTSPVYAAVIKDNGVDKLVFSSRTTGAHSDFTVDSSAAPGVLSTDPAYDRTGPNLNASINVDGGAEVNPESNIVDTAIPGVRVTLKGISASPVSVNTTQPAVDTTAIAAKVTAFVNAYNSAVTTVRADLTEKNDPKATTSSALKQGQLFGDSQLNGMLSQLKNQMTQTLSGLGLNSVADLGITIPKASSTVTDDAKDGKLVLDSAKLTTTLNADYTKVRDLFSGKGTTKGLSSLIGSFVDGQTSTTGILTGRMNSDDSTLKDFTDQITLLNSRMNDEQTRLKAQFAAMEAAMSQSQTQQAWLTSQISSLP